MRLLLFSLISLFCSLAVAENTIYITQIGDSDDTEININQNGDDNTVELSMNHDDNTLDFDQTVTGSSTGSNIVSWVTYWGSGLSWGGDLDGTGNSIKVEQWQNKGSNTNRVGFHINTNDNNVDICQGGIYSSSTDTTCNFDSEEYGGHTANLDLHTGGADVKISQTTGTNSSRSEGHYAQVYTYGGSNADVFIHQRGNGDKKAYVTIRSNDSDVNLVQKSDGDHTATIDLRGTYGTNLSVTQDSQTDQTYSLTNDCSTVGGCSVTVTQN
tara:strand:- start:509 stop:1318 length:810 start_codon:yes stop_codon:yes gene_type:complete